MGGMGPAPFGAIVTRSPHVCAEQGPDAASACRPGDPGARCTGLNPSSVSRFVSRPPDLGGPPPRKAVLSMNGLSYGVIRVDTEEKLSVLTVQDVGQVMPGGEGRAGMCVCD